MNFKRKLVAAAVILAASSPAFAAIDGSASGNGELFFSLIDVAGERSYTRDLGIRIDNFLPAVATAPGFSATFAADALLTSFLAATAPGNFSSLVWNVAALDMSGPNRVLTTAAALPGPSGAAPTQSNIQLRGFRDTGDIYLSNVNLLGTHSGGVAVNGSNTATVADGLAYAGSAIWGSNFGGRANFNNTAQIGQSNFFWLLSTNGTNTASSAIRHLHQRYAGPLATPVWTLGNDGTLSFAAPVPEPEAWAMFVAGILGVGAIARRRVSA